MNRNTHNAIERTNNETRTICNTNTLHIQTVKLRDSCGLKTKGFLFSNLSGTYGRWPTIERYCYGKPNQPKPSGDFETIGKIITDLLASVRNFPFFLSVFRSFSAFIFQYPTLFIMLCYVMLCTTPAPARAIYFTRFLLWWPSRIEWNKEGTDELDRVYSDQNNQTLNWKESRFYWPRHFYCTWRMRCLKHFLWFLRI